MQFKYGTDIEAFVNKDKEHISSQEVFKPGQKFKSESGIIERDGYAVEFQPNAGTVEEVFQNTKSLIIDFESNYDFKLNPYHVLNVNIQKLIEKDDFDSLRFGCKPDYKIYNKNVKTINKKVNASTVSLRTAGAHLHVGIPDWKVNEQDMGEYYVYFPIGESLQKSVSLLKWIDMFIGLKTTIYDVPSERRSLYGQAGDFRFTKWGVEYRTLSNYIILHPAIFFNIFKMLSLICERNYEVNYESHVKSAEKKEITKIINNYDRIKARDYFNYFVQCYVHPDIQEIFYYEYPKAEEISKDVSFSEFWK